MLPNPGKSNRQSVAFIDMNLMSVKCVWVFILVVLMSMPSSLLAQERALRSSLSSTTITSDESVTLKIVSVGMDEELDASSLEKDFEVVGRSSSREVSTVTGSNNRMRTTSIVTWALELIPRDVGVFTVPAVRVGDMSSQIHTLTVNDPPTGAQRDIFVEATVDTLSPWVQSQVLMSVKVFQAIDFVDAGLDVPSGADLVVERIGEDTRTTLERDGRAYTVTERRFALFPQKSGVMNIEPITLSVSVLAQRDAARGFFSPTRKLTRRTDSITLEVQPRPDAGSAWWLPAKAVQLESQWVGGVDQATVDQPLTRRIVMRAIGVADTQLPDINIPGIDGVSLYAEQPERAMGADSRGLIAEQVINWALIPQRAGELQIPAVTVDWFNTDSGRVETAVLPAETLSVTTAGSSTGTAIAPTADSDAESLTTSSQAGAETIDALNAQQSAELIVDQPPAHSLDGLSAGGSSSQNPLAPSLQAQLDTLRNSVSLWRSTALVVLALWFVSALYYWWWRRKQAFATGTPAPAQRELRLGAVRQAGADSLQRIKPLAAISAHCKSGDLVALRNALLDWSSRQWPDEPPLTLDTLAKRFPEGVARSMLVDVNSALYSRSGSSTDDTAWHDRLAQLPEQIKQALASHDADMARDAGSVSSRSSLRSSDSGLPSL